MVYLKASISSLLGDRRLCRVFFRKGGGGGDLSRVKIDSYHLQSGTKPLETSQVMHNLRCKLEFLLTETNSAPLSPFTMLVHAVTNSFWLKTALYGGRGRVMGKVGASTIFIESLKGFGPDCSFRCGLSDRLGL